ncbi:MAG: tetratricopeptide repeat protein [Candidatus Hydrogenedentes bacterium]|jgi:Flp pilus assembly protein TadD|nr:tetratricopeptide repeat protein [Candidatus Hydrogenedentota bacterium]
MNPPVPTPARTAPAYLLLALLVFAVFGQSLGFGFIHYDDPLLVTDNHRVLRGLTLDNTVWAFTSGYTGNWHPIAWLSHMLDIELYALNAGAHRVTSILLHMASAFALFSFLSTTTASPRRSAAVAALFAIHPLHVESVVWIAERKDLLCGLFWMLALLAYAKWASKPTALRYTWILLAFAAALMSKAMAVTLPFVLLLIDVWPLRRIASPREFPQRVREKIPLFAAAGLLSFIAFQTQHAAGATKSIEALSLPIRLASSIVSYGRYTVEAIWPSNLAVFYPHPGVMPPLWALALSSLALVFFTALAWSLRRRSPAVIIGWLWFLGGLVPVIGVVQIGDQAMADRYTYLPLIGLFIAAVWGVRDALREKAAALETQGIMAAGTVACVVVGVASWHQVRYWQDSVTLFQHTLAVSGSHPTIHNALGRAYYAEGRLAEAEEQYRLALDVLPGYSMAHNNLGLIYLEAGRFPDAEHAFREATAVTPRESRFFANLGIALAAQERTAEAEEAMATALELDPENPAARYNLAAFLLGQQRYEEAEKAFAALVAIDPGNVAGLLGWAEALARLGRTEDAQRKSVQAQALTSNRSP